MLLIDNAFIVTMNKNRSVIKNGSILIDNDTIVGVGDIKNKDDYSIKKRIDADGMLVMPGLINGHNHFEQSFMKGITRLFVGGTAAWIKEFKIPLTNAMGKEHYYYSNMLTAIELIKNGITTSVNSVCQQDPNKLTEFGLDMTVKAVKDTGIRSLVAVGAADKFEPDSYLVSSAKACEIIEWAIKKWNNTVDGRLRVWAGPAGLFSASKALWGEIKSIVDSNKVGIHTHVASFREGEVEEANSYGLLGPNITGAHCVWLSEREIDIMANAGMKVVHNPTYKLSYALDGNARKFGDGIAPIAELMSKGVTVGLGQDGCMGDTQDLFKEMRCLVYTQQYKYLDKSLLPPSRLLEMVTIDCAKTLLWENEIGSIETGKKADIIIVNTNNTNFYPRINMIASLVYQGNGYDVDTTIINGKIVMEKRIIKSIDEGTVLQEAEDACFQLIDRAGMGYLRNYCYRPWFSGHQFN